ncbi:MAG: 16S rRNA (guanine(527)-N(7))-methyltransferase RsmG [Butyrivibrio sp.]|uniref:16S rRNA (guanine(527)-N(7))-methyltransferase RsmG n=1 Tax=Butyrivibrio sp. TaxID=28121 RepID=UPI0025CC8AD3|nr:16S rRNA (guanine(527)-N(7))-methyltransferase RsmG [Butyrivibrio sp.]MCR5769783.1 16S rRNA (guanine(527)-N(7))-methyltransferase RsmG [Butyrivibrio sp.]
MNDYTKMINDLKSIGIELSDHQLEQFDKYYNLLVKWNEVMNLTAITEFNDVCQLHFVDSIMAAPYFDFTKKGLTLIDVGTGAGFPGIPLKIVFPQLKVTLLDSLNKRLNFLNEVIQELELTQDGGSIETVHGRAEDYSKSKGGVLREKFDIGTARAVANMSTLSEYILPYVKVGGHFVAYKSNKINDEIDLSKIAIKTLGGSIKSVNNTFLPGSDIERSIVIINKSKPTPKLYPRKAGLPSKQPL